MGVEGRGVGFRGSGLFVVSVSPCVCVCVVVCVVFVSSSMRISKPS